MNVISATWTCPSNIALVKYWGKKEGGIQLPANPSISFTLSDLVAKTTIQLPHGNVSGKPAFSFLLDGKPQLSFHPKIEQFLQRIWNDFSVVRDFHLHIESSNNFPHGTGIASSAAGFGALALCICDLQEQVSGQKLDGFYQKASTIARLGSGSACRSVYDGPAVWGETEACEGSSDAYAVAFSGALHESFQDFCDIVLIIDESEKKVSSTEGHSLLVNNPYAAARYQVAADNLKRIADALTKGNMRSFISIVESEAMQLHAMMMASSPGYILMRPNTLAAIEAVWNFRESQSVPLMFTLDAGANVHLLFPKVYKEQIVNFIQSDLLPLCKNGLYLCSDIGKGPEKLIHAE